MTDLIAKPIVNNQFWIVIEGDKKVGNIEVNSEGGYGLKMNGNSFEFNSADELKTKMHIKFETIKVSKNKSVMPHPEFPTTDKIYNSVFDVRRGLHLYTKTRKSKCQYAAGWFVIDQPGLREIVFCPKYIFIQRYPYSGPFRTKNDAENVINTV